MTHRNPKRRDYDTANLNRRASFARSPQYLEVWRMKERLKGPYIADLTGMSQDEIVDLCEAVDGTGGKWTIRQGRCPDMKGGNEG